MFYKNIDKMFDACYEELVCSHDERIQKCIKQIRNLVGNDDEEAFIMGFIRMNIREVLFGEIDEEEFDDLFVDYFEEAVEKLKDVKKSIVLKVELMGQEEKLNRIIEIPYCFSVADMAYAILGTFNADGEHMFYVEYKDEKYYCSLEPDDYMAELAENVYLPTLQLRKNSKMELCYDFGDHYLFHIQVVEIKTYKDLFALEQMQVMDGEGYGIWEDEHYALDLYLDNPKEFYNYVKEQELELAYYDLDSEFDLEESQDDFLDEYYTMKGIYE